MTVTRLENKLQEALRIIVQEIEVDKMVGDREQLKKDMKVKELINEALNVLLYD